MAHVDLDVAGIRFECADTWVSRWVCTEILEGKTYPHLGFVDDVQVVWDVGANCGATTVFLAHHHPDAVVHAFEPAREPRAILERNVSALPNVHVHPIGLYSEDRSVPLYHGDGDSILGSVHRRAVNTDESEPVELRAAGRWASANGIDRIDVLKVDVEGCEAEVLSSLAGLLRTVKVLYVEYNSRAARRSIDGLLTDHEFWFSSQMALDQGECIYLRADLADAPGANHRLHELYHASRGALGVPPPDDGA
jgi:FkbM family methyltransferase